MNQNHDLEERLDRLAQSIRLEQSLQPAVMEKVRSLPSQKNSWRLLPMMKFLHPAWSAPVLLGLALAGWYAISTTSPRLYAQALEAIIQATSVHAVGEFKREDGAWEKGMEIWYHRDYGVVERQFRNGITRTRIDNHQYQWRSSSDNKIAVKNKSEDPVGVIRKIFDREKFHSVFPNKPNEETTIDGETLSIYSSMPNAQSRIDAWVDRQGRIRRFIEFHKTTWGAWEKVEITELDYDIPIDKAIFEPRFDNQAIIKDWTNSVDAISLLDKLFDLNQAFYKREEFGLIFAVHEFKSLDNGLIYLLTSMRPSEELLKELGPIRYKQGGENVYGDYQLDSSWKRLPDGTEQSYQPLNLAFLSNNGFYAKWSILIPKGTWPETVNEVELSLLWFTRGKLQEKLQMEKKNWLARFRPLAVFPTPERDGSLEELLTTLYETGLQLEPVVSQMGFYKASVPDLNDEEKHLKRVVIKPSEISFENFMEENRKEYERLKQNKQPG